ncbi:hypothetical protein Rhe02_08400 [Rhizocola hellebori]|uniref:Thioredoxin domain-containing protein n=1 Tax=Rhizocola hellebori TaxID=1392758 RepID=A0A8J3VE57_9ACTN|nr:redoxin family protein [Rhizocola hellebori]GIH02773.1 hypothetical protein Rhe02_08400 [Rhizocola hellebori]
MPYLIAAVALVGALCVLDLILTFGVIRRLRHHTELLNKRGQSSGPSEKVMLDAGEEPGDFVATTNVGEQISKQELVGDTVVGFFTAHCEPCKERVPQYLDHVATLPGGKDRTLAVVIGNDADSLSLAEQLAAGSRVVMERPGGDVVKAFQVTGYPALCVLDGDGRIKASGFKLDEILEKVPA